MKFSNFPPNPFTDPAKLPKKSLFDRPGEISKEEKFRRMAEEALKATQAEMVEKGLFEELENLREQYEQQVQTLKEVGFIFELPKSKEFGFVDISGTERIVPTFEALAEHIGTHPELREIMERKADQGFKQLQLTPFGAPLEHLTKKTSELILKKYKAGKLKATSGEDLALNTKQPLWISDGYNNADTNGSLVYYPTQYTEHDHGGKTKAELLAEQQKSNPTLAGWTILLHEGLKDLPAHDEGEEKGGRHQLEANKTPDTYLNDLATDPQYAHETGTTPEDWLTYFATTLQTDNQVIDDYQGQGKINWNLAGFFPGSRAVSDGYWDRSDRRADLSRGVAGARYANSGGRPAVRLH